MKSLSLNSLQVLAFVSIATALAPSPWLTQNLDAQQTDTKLTVANTISDHMVLQAGKATAIWGKGQPSSKVTIQFAGQTLIADVAANGTWKASLKPLTISSTGATMSVTSDAGDSLEISDILVGQVWMCSGQSNMAFTLARSESPDYSKADLPTVRFFKTASKTATSPQSDCDGKWEVMTPDSSKNCSAVAYYFGRKLNQELNIPIGLIDTSWGGKPVEAFTSLEKLNSVENATPLIQEWNALTRSYDPEAATARYETSLAKWKVKVADLRKQMKTSGKKVRLPRRPQKQVQPATDPNHPASIYNAKVAPWLPYAIEGAIWYQGESNRNRAVQYKDLLTALIEDWRSRWNDPIPFYIVQLASFTKPSTEPGTADAWAELQHAQTLVATSVPDCGVAVTNDIGAANDIHPKNKKDVGNRLALLALKRSLGDKLKGHASPLYASHKIKADHVLIDFETFGGKLTSRDGKPLQRFEVAGEDQKWYWATAEIVGTHQVDVYSKQVPAPVAVRYAWAANPEGANLVNDSGLPASLFRTDDWPLSTANNFTRRNPNDTARLLVRDGFRPLFNRKNLNGWRNPYDHGEAKVINEEIHLTGNKKFFLVTKKKYSDFQLVVDIKLPAGKANSGVMFRCHVEPNRVYGYQAEVDGSDRCWSGGLYEEGRRQWIWPSTKGRSEEKFLPHEEESKAHFAKPRIKNALKRTDWNRYEITCRQDHISIRVNGILVTDFRDDTDAEGFIGIQHHGEKGQTYQFRNLYIKELK